MLLGFKYISAKKLFNLLKIVISYYLSIIFKKVIVWGYPYSISIEPTNKCNLRCLECPAGNKSAKRESGYLDLNLYKKIIDELKDIVLYQMLYFQGEPFLHPDFFKLVEYADKQKIYTVTSTNGHFLSKDNCLKLVKSGLKKLIISVDGMNQSSYEKYRVGGDLSKVISGIKNLVSVKQNQQSKFPIIELQFIVFKHNEHQIKEIKKLSRELGVNKLQFKSAQIENLENNAFLIPSLNKFSRYDIKKQMRVKSKSKHLCFRVWSTAVISWDGFLIPCCFDKKLQYKLGALGTQNMNTLWKSSDFMGFRNDILTKRKKYDICSNCSEGLRIKY